MGGRGDPTCTLELEIRGYMGTGREGRESPGRRGGRESSSEGGSGYRRISWLSAGN